jgi:hypothetical protein
MQPMGAIVRLVGIKDPSLFLTGEISPKRHINLIFLNRKRNDFGGFQSPEMSKKVK